jgi:hypothetical protein
MNVHNDKVSSMLNPSDDLWADMDVSQREIITKHEFLVMGYAMAIIVLAMGLVFLVILLATLMFFFPDKSGPFANTCILLLGGPLATLVALNIKSIANLIRDGYRISKGNKSNVVEK